MWMIHQAPSNRRSRAFKVASGTDGVLMSIARSNRSSDDPAENATLRGGRKYLGVNTFTARSARHLPECNRRWEAARHILMPKLVTALYVYGVQDLSCPDLATRAAKGDWVIMSSVRVGDTEPTVRLRVQFRRVLVLDVVYQFDGIDYRIISSHVWKSGPWQRYVSAIFPRIQSSPWTS